VVKRRYVPERGDLVWLDFYPQSGREQKGRRPALVLSPREYNLKSGLALCCPITSKVKGYPFETAVETAGEIRGVILCDQIRSLDWRARRARLIGHASPASLDDALAKVEALLRR
jgi:mRNA interferase MazF